MNADALCHRDSSENLSVLARRIITISKRLAAQPKQTVTQEIMHFAHGSY